MTADKNNPTPDLYAILSFDSYCGSYDAAAVTITFQELRADGKELAYPYHYSEYAHLELTAAIDKDDAKAAGRNGALDWRANQLTTSLYHPDLAEMEAAVKAIKSINRKLDAISAKYGHSANFAQNVMRICAAAGIKYYIRADERLNGYYQTHGVSRLDYEFSRIADKCRPAAVPAESVIA